MIDRGKDSPLLEDSIMVVSKVDRSDIDACKAKLQEVWGQHGLWVVLIALAEVVEDDLNVVARTSYARINPDKFVKEQEGKDTIISLLKQAAKAPALIED
jgi:hypothetical protein